MLQISRDLLRGIDVERARGGGPSNDFRSLFKCAGLRPTWQRMALAELLFRDGCHRHVTADDLHQEACAGSAVLSLATVYNTLNQFAEAGLIRKVGVSGERTYFDTDPGDHQHFYIEAEDRIIDVEPEAVRLAELPVAPLGYEIAGVDVVLRLRAVSAADSARATDRQGRAGDDPS